MKQQPTTIDKLIELPTPNDTQISPDGQWIAYTVTHPDWQENVFISQVYLIATHAGTEPQQLTFSKGGSSTPRWSPDSKEIIFLSKRDNDKGQQIYRLAIQGGEAQRLTTLETSITNCHYAPDSKTIAFIAVPPKTPQQKQREEKFGDYVQDNVDYQYQHIWALTVADKKVWQLTSGADFHALDFKWHPDSQRLAVTAMPAPDMGLRLEARIYLLDSHSLALDILTAKPSGSPLWSPDGRELLYERGLYDAEDGAFYRNNHLEILTLDSGETRALPVDHDENIYPVRWAADGIYFLSVLRTSIHLLRVDTAGGTPEVVTPQDVPGFRSSQFSFDTAAKWCACVSAHVHRFNEVTLIDLKSSELTTLTDYDAPAREWNLPASEVTAWTSSDGTEIEGVLTKPADFDPAKQYPLLVIIHGGPTGISTPTRLGYHTLRIYPLYQWAAQGAVILEPNYRGSAGYGEAFRSLNVQNLGVGDYADVISGVDALISEGYIDADKVGAMGWSQGGYISAFITAYSDRFQAVSVGAGISNWMTYYVNTDIHPFTINYLKATPWDDPDIYAKTSPMTYIKQAQTPTLIQHGEKDARVPLPNAFELHQGLLDQGVESKLVVYPGMPHGPNKPRQSRHIMNDNFVWFNRHIFGIEADPADPAPLYIALAHEDGEKNPVTDVAHLARRDAAHFRVITAAGTLSDAQNDASFAPDVADLNAVITTLAEQLAALDSKHIVLYTAADDEQMAIKTILGCLHIAAARSGIAAVKVEQRDSTT